VGTYQWTSGWNVGAPEDSVDADTAWYTPDFAPVTALSVASPNGHGDVLVRTEVAYWITVVSSDASTLLFFPESAGTLALGDVGAVGGSGPDPRATGSTDFSFSASTAWTVDLININFLSSYVPCYCKTSTGGYLTSKAKRGPEIYGGVDPAFNLALYTVGSSYLDLTVSTTTPYWSISARALWFTP